MEKDNELRSGINQWSMVDGLSPAVYPLMEHYYTIQGEGYNTGKACYFLRLGGCDVGCVWCDVKESWDVNLHPIVSVDEMMKYVNDANAKRVVITGGEPLMHNLTFLTQK